MNFRYDNFKKTTKKIERMGGSFFDKVLLKRTDKEELSEYLEVNYYRGKIMAYLYVLERLVGVKKAYQLLYKGIQGEKNIDKYGNKIKKHGKAK